MICDGRDVHIVDISNDVIDVALGIIPDATAYLIDDVSSFKAVSDALEDERIDLLIAFSVIYHFPSLEYFHAIADLWKRISPKYIVIKTMMSHGDSWERSSYKVYEESVNYIRGLLLSEDDLCDALKGYSMIFSHNDETTPGLFGKINKLHGLENIPAHMSKLYVFKKISN
tara:strand:- start:8436 stop:8948 length:513 start_codon:yes stop_codon:yes gene_type:complete